MREQIVVNIVAHSGTDDLHRVVEYSGCRNPSVSQWEWQMLPLARRFSAHSVRNKASYNKVMNVLSLQSFDNSFTNYNGQFE